jgi:hypothetical protein
MPRYIVETALIVAIAIFIITQALSGEIATSAGTVGIFLSGGLRLTASLLPLQSALLSIKQAIPPAKSALNLIREPHLTINTDSPASGFHVVGGPLGVSIRDLRFAYKKGGPETIKNVSLRLMRDFSFRLPPLELQEKITSVLSALDERITLLRETNATLEAIAQAIFKGWFVEFNFPGATGKMVESELGMIPLGWRVGKLGEMVDAKGGTTPSTKEENPLCQDSCHL